MGEGYKEIILQWSFNLWCARGEKGVEIGGEYRCVQRTAERIETQREREREHCTALHSDAVRSPRCELVTISLLLGLMRVHIAFFPPTYHPSCSLQSMQVW
jgi:hypothetical protein